MLKVIAVILLGKKDQFLEYKPAVFLFERYRVSNLGRLACPTIELGRVGAICVRSSNTEVTLSLLETRKLQDN